MNFEKWFKGCPLIDDRHVKAAWNAAIDEAIEKINSHPAITDIEGYAIFPELAEAIKELKEMVK